MNLLFIGIVYQYIAVTTALNVTNVSKCDFRFFASLVTDVIVFNGSVTSSKISAFNTCSMLLFSR